MFGKKSVQVLVVGAGPSGMTAALSLALRGIDTAIIDKASRCCTQSNALVLHPTTLKLLDQYRVAEEIIASGYRIDKVIIYDQAQSRHTIHLRELSTDFPFAVSIPQSELELILKDKLRHYGVPLLWKHRATEATDHDQGIIVDVDRSSDHGTGYAISRMESVVDKTLHFDTKFVVAADGYNSLMRRIAKVETAPLADDQYYAFFDFETDMDPEHSIRISIKDGLSTAQYPMTDGISRLSFQYSGLTLPIENRNKDRSLFEEESVKPLLADLYLKDLIDQRVPWNIGYINKVIHRSVVPFEKKYLKSPCQARIAFIGDAARTFGPLSMTSMNLGMLEGEQIAVALKEMLDLNLPTKHLNAVGESMVEHWEALTNLESHSTPTATVDSWTKENQARILRSLPATGKSLETLANQLGLHLRMNDLVVA